MAAGVVLVWLTLGGTTCLVCSYLQGLWQEVFSSWLGGSRDPFELVDAEVSPAPAQAMAFAHCVAWQCSLPGLLELAASCHSLCTA